MRIIIFIALLGYCSIASANTLESKFQRRFFSQKEKIVTLKPKDFRATLKSLRTLGFDVAGVNLDDATIDVIVSNQDLVALKSLKDLDVTRDLDINRAAPDEQYFNYQELTESLKSIQSQHSDIMKLVSIGKSVEGRDIWAVKLSDNVELKESDEPVVFFNSMHHAREVMTTEIAVDMIQELTKKFETDIDVGNFISQLEIWVVPMVNPDGNNRVWTSNNMWRKNTGSRFGVDINRNYPFKWGQCDGSSGSVFQDDYRGPSAASEPETRAMMGLVSSIKPVMSISYHSYSELVLYPYSCDGERTEDHELFISMGHELAQKLPKDGASGFYKPGTPWEILYGVDGGDIDWMYQEHGTLPFVIEVSSSNQGFQPKYAQWRDKTVQKMRASWTWMLQRALSSGVKGRVGQYVPKTHGDAMVQLKSLATGKVARRQNLNLDGTFHLVVEPGMYQLEVITKLGSQDNENITVGSSLVGVQLDLKSL